MSDLLIINVIFFVLVFSPLLMIGGSMLGRRSFRRQLSSLAGPLDARETNSWMDPIPHYQAEQNGVIFDFEIRHIKHEPAGFYLNIPTDRRGHFFLRREESRDQLFKSAGLSRELQTGDEVFDRTFDITVAGPREFARLSLAHGETRAALLRLLALGFDTVGLVKRRGSPRFFRMPTRETMLEAFSRSDLWHKSPLLDAPERVRESVRLLDLIRRQLPANIE
jgi:hypothetical protein